VNIEDQVVSLELSKQLKEIGIKQKSLFWHRTNVGNDENIKLVHCIGLYGIEDDETWSAFTASELIEILPNSIFIKEQEPFGNFRFRLDKRLIVAESNPDNLIPKLDKINVRNIYNVNYYCDSTECSGENAWIERKLLRNINDEKLTDSLANLIIQLHESGYLK
jgi:hypothetical protein